MVKPINVEAQRIAKILDDTHSKSQKQLAVAVFKVARPICAPTLIVMFIWIHCVQAT